MGVLQVAVGQEAILIILGPSDRDRQGRGEISQSQRGWAEGMCRMAAECTALGVASRDGRWRVR